MDAVVLAGGLGQRLRPLTAATPKPLLPIGNSCALDTALRCLRRGGAVRVMIAAGYRADLVQDYVGDGSRWELDVQVSVESEPLGTVGPLGLLREELQDPFVLMNGDVITTLDFRRFRRQAGATRAALTAVTTRVKTHLPYGQVLGTGNRIDGVLEKPELSLEVLAGIYLVRPTALVSVPDGRPFGVDDLIEALLERGCGVHRYPTDAYWRDIGQPADYRAAQQEYERFFGTTPHPECAATAARGAA